MSEIKFRVWGCKEYNYKKKSSDGYYAYELMMLEVLSINLVGDWNNETGDKGEPYVTVPYKSLKTQDYPLKNVILMQYTGLKDKNGKEIYEGDIIKDYSSPMKVDVASLITVNKKPVFICRENYIVKWIGCGFKIFNEKYGIKDFKQYINLDIKVIGNIHENPELLNQ